MKKVVVGLSGGVDSAVAAYLLQQKGYEVVGVTMRQFGDCVSEISDARAVADILGIEHTVIDARNDFDEKVIKYFVNEYLAGRTPNPCIMCNPLVKFDVLLREMDRIGADNIATGHYSEITRLDNGRYSIKRSQAAKDQSYALARLNQRELEFLLTPLAGFEKDKIRDIATKVGIPVANKNDSQDICFIQNGDYAKFISANFVVSDEPGKFVDESGNVLGEHKGITHYTVGQRKKLGLAMNRPVYVKEIRIATNEIVISTQSDVFDRFLRCNNLVCMAGEKFEEGKRLCAKVRYADKGNECTVFCEDKCLRVEFEQDVRAVTPGQAIVFYDGDIIYGSGIII